MKQAKRKPHPHVFVPKDIVGAVDAQISAARERLHALIDNYAYNREQDLRTEAWIREHASEAALKRYRALAILGGTP